MKIGKVLLLRPPLLSDSRIGHEEPHPPLELAYLGAALENECTVKIIDAFAQYKHIEKFQGRTMRSGMSDGELIEVIDKEKPEMVCISGMWTNQKRMVDHIAGLIKTVNPCIITVVGGNLASTIPNVMLENLDIDYCIVGEGEESIAGLLREIREDGVKTRSKVKGVARRLNGDVVFNGHTFVHNLDTLPMPAYHLLNFDIYDTGFKWGRLVSPRFMGILATRGCTYTCNFCCLYNVGGRVFRHHSIERIILEIEMLKARYGIGEIQFYDYNLLNDSKFAKSLFKEMARSQVNLPWVAAGGLSPWELDNEMIELAIESGMYRLDLPIESASKVTRRKIMDKDFYDISDIKRIISKARDSGIKKIYAYVIVGSPQETKESIEESLYLLNELDVDMRVVKYAQPFPGTKFYDICVENSYLLPNFSYDRLWFSIPNLKTQTVKLQYLLPLVQADKVYSLARRKMCSLFQLIIEVFKRFGLWTGLGTILLLPSLAFRYRKLNFLRKENPTIFKYLNKYEN